jgi:hypothetical protein
VTVALLLAAATSTALGVSSQWGSSKNFVVAKGACRIDALLLTIFAVGFLLTAQPVAVLLGFQYSPNLGMLGQRLGSMFSVFLPFAFLWLIFDAASKRWKRPVEPRLFLAALAVPAVLASIVAATELTFNVTQVRTRLRGHSAALASAVTRPASFAYNNELHTIWYSIIKSAVHGKDYVVQIQPGVPAE